VANDPTVNITKFLGLYNKQQSRRLPVGALTVVENVDIDDTDGIVRRQGYQSKLSLPNVTSAFATQDQRRCFVISDGNLLFLQEDLSYTSLASGLSTEFVYWEEVADYVLLSTGHVIDGDNQVSMWRIDSPPQPKVTLSTGDLREGQYQVAVTYVDSLGREGGASPVVVLNINAGEAITVTPNMGNYSLARVYCTEANGSQLYLAGETATAITLATDSSLVSPIEADQLGAFPAPAQAQILAHYDGRLFAAEPGNGVSIVWFSVPYWWNLFKLQSDFFTVPGDIRSIVSHSDGLIIGTDDEIYVYNGSLTRVAKYGVPDGVPATKDDTGTVFLWTKQGLCSALPFTNLTSQKCSLPTGNVCTSAVVEQNGFRKVVVLTDAEGTADNQLL